MNSTTWRDKARPIIAAVIAEVGTQDEKRLRLALFRAWPGGPRKYWPYRVWCDEIRVQLGKKKPAAPQQTRARNEKQAMLEAGQIELPL